MAIGPRDTLIVGYENGVLGLWNLNDGSQLGHGRLHGPVVHLLLEQRHLFAASELGGQLSWDLSPFFLADCALAKQVASHVGVAWEHGRPVKVPYPDHHPCFRD